MVFLLCKICDRKITFSEWKKHITNETHVKNLPTSIFIKAIPNQFDTICEYFAKFGKITKREVSDCGTTIEISYENPNIYSDVVHQEHAIFGDLLKIFWYKTVKSVKVLVSFTRQEEIFNSASSRILALANLLKDSQLFDDEVKIFMDTVKSHNYDFGKKCQVIRGLLLSKFPQVSLYGSSVLELDVFNRNCNFYVMTNEMLSFLLNSNRFSNCLEINEVSKRFVGKVTVELIFNYNKVTITVKKNNNVCYHLAHLIFVKLQSFFPENKSEVSHNLVVPSTSHESENIVSDTTTPNNLVQVIIKQLKSGTNLLHQLLLLLKNLQVKNYKDFIVNDLKFVLVSKFPKMKLFTFGSKEMKVDTCFSHLDLSLDKIESSDMSVISELLSKSDIFTNVSFVNNAIQCTHQATKTICKLWFVNHLWLANDRLLRWYFKFGVIIRQMCMVVKFWTLCNNLEGDFTSYVVYLLVIFYLQQTKIPSVKTLQKDAPKFTINKWNCGFKSGLSRDDNFKGAKLTQLLAGFFHFYSNFDYISYVISPHYGTSIHKINLPEAFENSGLCVQDFFILSSNVTASMPLNIAGIFTNLCQKTYRVFTLSSPQLHTVLSRCGTTDSTSFLIEMDQGRNEPAWRQSIKEHTLKIVTKIFACKIININNSDADYKCDFVELKHFWDKRESFMKQLNSSDIERDVAITTHITKVLPGDADWKSSLELKFYQNPPKVQITITGNHNHAHTSHFFHTRLVKLLGEKPVENDIQVSLLGNDEEYDEWTGNYAELYRQTCENIEGDYFFQLSALRKIQKDAKTNIDIVTNDVNLALKPIFNDIIGLSQVFLPGDIIDIFVENTQESELAGLKLIKYLISKSGDFCDVSIVKKHQILVVTCTHEKTKIVCHLNNRQKMAHDTSNLIRAFLQRKPLRLFFVIIKLWTGRCKFKDECGFTGYIFTLMIVFFLQQELQYPSITDLQKPVKCKIVDGWNCAFEYPKLSKIPMRKSHHELLVAFFKFYSDFDYISLVISPFLGVGVKKTEFLNKKFPVNSGLCVQDPFDHSCNVSASISLNSSGKFAEMCRRAHQLLEGNYDLRQLVNPTISDFSSFNIVKTGGKTTQEWFQFLRINTFKILFDMLGCKVSLVGKYSASSVTFNCVLNHDIWSERLAVLKKLNDSDVLNRETSVTKFIKEKCGTTCLTKFVVDMFFEKDPISVQVQVRGDEGIFHLTHFIYTRLLLILDKEVKMDVDQGIFTLGISPANQGKENDAKMSEMSDGVSSTIGGEENEANHEEFIVISDEGSSTIEEEQNEANHEEFTEISDKSEDFKHLLASLDDNEMGFFSKTDNLKTRDLIKTDLCSALSSTFPSHKIEFFGSSVTNVGFKSSNFDINVDNVATLELLQTRILACSRFSNVSLIKDKQMMIVKHNETEANCCLYVKNKMWVITSDLINYYLSLDPKLRDVFSVINFWADCYGLKNGYFTSYSLNLMVIFYLQQEPYRLPRVKDLQRNTIPVIVDGWSCAFNCLKYDSQALQNASIIDLVIGFFRYYANFDYVSFVISPFFGSVIEKFRFLNQNFVVNCGVAIQNVFELSKNVSPDVPLECVGRFAALCRSSVEVLTKEFKLTHLLEAKADCMFEIGNLYKRCDDFIEKQIFKVFKILDAKMTEKSTKFSYECEVKKSVFDNVKKISSPIYPPSEVTREIIVTTLSEGLIKFSLKVNITENICKIVLNGGQDLIYFITHFIYIKLLKYLSEKPPQNFETNENLINETIEEEEDVPSDFFDDFSSEEFLNGLDLNNDDFKDKASRKRSYSFESSTPPRQEKQRKTTSLDFPQSFCNFNTSQPTRHEPVDNIDQFFVERKISLSDFLTVTSQREIKTNCEEKMKVILRCQDAIKILSGDLSFPSKFKVVTQPSQSDSKLDKIKHRSPLHRNPFVKFNFTNYQEQKLDKFSQILDRVLQKLGFLHEDNDLENLIDSISTALVNSPIVDKETVASILKASLLNLNCMTCDSKLMRPRVDVGTQCRIENEKNAFDEDSGTYFD
ncbi:uncharacterized protein LOC123005746 isoform X2 [Tribolium madens]|uniref:uncharacterized protein LOC123005746 isoform X2 n=1 Tax=Tribolium madens TaxID=41895 RepID=UPI001CF74045|nr:uncharacterized protein LOC123005746 isoform X2 [Tribolium madens]